MQTSLAAKALPWRRTRLCLHLAKWAAEQVDAKIAPVRRRRRLQISLFASSAAASWVDAMSESASLGAVAQAHPNHFEWFRSGARTCARTRKGLLIQLAIVCGVRKRVDGRERASAFSLCVCVCLLAIFGQLCARRASEQPSLVYGSRATGKRFALQRARSHLAASAFFNALH